MLPRHAALLASLASTACAGEVPATRIAFPEEGVEEVWDPPRFDAVVAKAGPAVEVELELLGEFGLEEGPVRPREAFVDHLGRIVLRDGSRAVVHAATGELVYDHDLGVGDLESLFVDREGQVCSTDMDEDCHRCTDGRGPSLLCLPFEEFVVDPARGRRWLTFWFRPDLIYGLPGGDRFDRMIDRATDGLRWREVYGLACDRAGDLAVLDGPREPLLSCFRGNDPRAPVGAPPREGLVLALLSWDDGVLGTIDVTDVSANDLRRYRLGLARHWALFSSSSRDAYLVHRRDAHALRPRLPSGPERWGFGLSPEEDELWAIDLEGARVLRYLLP